MRKRARKDYAEEPKHIEKKKEILKPKRNYKKITTFGILIAIFFLVLFFNSFFNFTSGVAYNPDGTTLGQKYFLSGPDPYLNMRVCEVTLQTGTYPFVQPTFSDPLLNYPIGLRGSRPPLFTTFAVASAHVLQPIFGPTDALGWSMLFLPAIYGALLVFPVYGIGKEIFNRKVGLIAAFFVAIIPIHISSGHGSALSLFDHDSFIQLLFALTFYFTIKTIKEKDNKKSLMYSSFGGLFLGSTYLAWTSSQLLFMMLLVYLVFQVCFNIYKKVESNTLPAKFTWIFLSAFLISLPYMVLRHDYTGFPFITMIVSLGILVAYYFLSRYKTPYIVSLPILFTSGGIFFLILYLINREIIGVGGAIKTLSITVFGEGIYGTKISQTVAEAHTYGLSNTVMSIGPVMYWLGLAGFILFCYLTYKQKWKPENFFFILVFLVDLILTGQAGRFLNDQIPSLAVFSAFVTLIIVDKINLKKIVRDVKEAGGGFHGIRKGVHILQFLGIIFIIFGLLIPNVFLTFDAAIPPPEKEKMFGSGYQGVFGTSLYQEYYWSDADYWLSQQDTEIPNDADKPAFISWWDYGFFEVAMGKHPAVAENYQDGIPPASNLHTATTENEAIAVFIIRLVEGVKHSNDVKAPITEPVKELFIRYLPSKTNTTVINNETVNITTYPGETLINYLEDPARYCPSYNQLIDPEYGNTVMRVQDVNAMYRDSIKLLTTNLTDEQIVNLLIDMEYLTGWSIRYYGVETYDTQIFNVFSFLSDKSTMGFLINGVVPEEDRYMRTIYTDTLTGQEYTRLQLEKIDPELVQKMDLQPSTVLKDEYFNTIFYKVYYGPYNNDGQITTNRLPTYLLKHFKLAYVSPYVVIAEYYPCATVKGCIKVNNTAYSNSLVVVRDEFGVPHDYAVVDYTGNFSLLVPAGKLNIGVMSGDKETERMNITVTEDEANRKTEYNEFLNINIEPASFNLTVNTNQTGLQLAIYNELEYIQRIYPIDSFNQTFTFNDLLPANYKISVMNSTDYSLYNTSVFLNSGDNTFNVTVPS